MKVVRWRDYRDLIILIAVVSECAGTSHGRGAPRELAIITFYRKCLKFSRLACGLDRSGFQGRMAWDE